MLLFLLVGGNVANEFTQNLAVDEEAIIESVAEEYKLTGDKKRLLWAIRKSENGGPGREFGVLVPEAMRFENDPRMSMITQARWAAGTIKKRFKGSIDTFAARWAPTGAKNDPTGLNKNLPGNLKYYMELRKEMENDSR